MKVALYLITICSFCQATQVTEPADRDIVPSAHFVSAVQFAVNEPSAPLLKRSQRLVKEQFAQSLEVYPALQSVPFDVRVLGNEIVFYLMTDSDVQALMQQAMSSMIQNLNGKVRAKGRTSFYRTALPQDLGGYLETMVNNKRDSVVAISAYGVPFRDVLGQLRDQLGRFSYFIPGECLDAKVNYRFQSNGEAGQPLAIVLEQLASVIGLKLEQRNNTHIFKGSCAGVNVPPPTAESQMVQSLQPLPLHPSEFGPGGHPLVRQVHFPVTPLGQ